MAHLGSPGYFLEGLLRFFVLEGVEQRHAAREIGLNGGDAGHRKVHRSQAFGGVVMMLMLGLLRKCCRRDAKCHAPGQRRTIFDCMVFPPMCRLYQAICFQNPTSREASSASLRAFHRKK